MLLLINYSVVLFLCAANQIDVIITVKGQGYFHVSMARHIDDAHRCSLSPICMDAMFFVNASGYNG